MARRGRALATKGLSGGGSIPDVGMDNLLTAKKPLGPVGKIGKRGFKTAKKFGKAIPAGK